jgi:anti-anti-sigma factor
MMPKSSLAHLTIRMKTINYDATEVAAPNVNYLQTEEDTELKLTVETRNSGDVLIVHCQGSLVYRDEPSDLVRVVSDIFQHTSRVVVDVSGLGIVDGSGLGEFAQLQTRACKSGARVCFAAPNALLRNLLTITNLDSVLEVRDTVTEAVESLMGEAVIADC